MTTPPATVDVSAARAQVVQCGLRLEYLTVGWNALEFLIALVAGLVAGSIALVGFGLDSIIEVASGGVLLWRLRQDADAARRERFEARALKLVGFSFLALALYILIEAGKSLLQRESPEKSAVGIALAAVSLVVMPLLARAKRRVAGRLRSRALHADSRQTEICAYMSAVLLAGLVLNALLGWWWTDPLAALGLIPFIVKEGLEALRGDPCCAE